MDLQVFSLHSLVLGLGCSCVGQLTSFLSSSPPRSALQHWPKLAHPVQQTAMSRASSPVVHPPVHFTLTHTTRPSSTVCPSKAQGPLSGLLYLVRGRASSPILMSPRWAPSPVAGGKGCWAYFLYPCHPMPYEGGCRGSSPALMPTGMLHLHPHQQCQF